jgi:hypothetical protein
MVQSQKAFLKTFVVIFIVDSILVPISLHLILVNAEWGQLLGIPLFVLNLPALPLAVIYALTIDHQLPVTTGILIAMWTSEILMSSLVWGYVARKWVERKVRSQQSHGFPVIIKDDQVPPA